MKKKINEKKYSAISKRALEEMTQFRESTKHTQSIPLGEHISIKIRKMKTIHTDKEADINVDLRKFLNNKYPFKYGRQGISIPYEKWSEFVQAIIDFSMSACPEIFDEAPQPVQSQENVISPSLRQDQVVKTPEQQKRADDVRYVGQEPKRKKSIPIEDQSWIEITSRGKK